MSTDPLSAATRTAKRNLLLAAMAGITYSAFDVSISKIPIGNIAIDFDNRVFAFLLVATLLYFLGTFALYYFIDVKNIEQTKHQSDKEKNYRAENALFPQRYAQRTMTRIEKLLAPRIEVSSSSSPRQIEKFLIEMENPQFEVGLVDHFVRSTRHGFNLELTKEKRSDPRRPINLEEDEPELSHKVNAALQHAFDKYLLARRLNIARVAVGLYGVRTIYLIRNYLVDGAFPIALAIVALTSILQLTDLDWLKSLVPNPNRALTK